MKKMKRGIKASRAVMMMMMMFVLVVQAHNVTNSNNDDDDDDELWFLFPDAISYEMHGRVLQQGGGTKTGGTSDANNPAFNSFENRYAQDYNGPSPQNPNGAPGCRDPYNRLC